VDVLLIWRNYVTKFPVLKDLKVLDDLLTDDGKPEIPPETPRAKGRVRKNQTIRLP